MKTKEKKMLSQTHMIALGFLLIICIGTLLLMLPFSSRSGEVTDFFSCLFTATSASCVTGLVVFDTFSHWSVFGQLVILAMIQLGGLGFMSVGVFFSIFLRRKIGLRERGLLQESVNALQIGGIVRLVKQIMKGTALIEGIGAILLSIRFVPEMGLVRGIYNGVFHSVSAFCNAGFDLMGRYEPYCSLVPFYDDPIVNLVISFNIIAGGIGFIVWDDIARNKLHFRKYLLHTKIVLVTTGVLLAGGAVLFAIFERNNLMADMSVSQTLWTSLFSSVTARTAGFNSIDTGALTESSKLLTVILMFIGGSPGSTAGGIKTTTIVVMMIYIWSNLRGKHSCDIFGRRISDDVIKKASLVFCMNLFIAVTAIILICSFQPLDGTAVIFEVISAIGTVGMTTGITRALTIPSKVVIILLMYAGRIGSMTFALSFTERKKVPPVQLPAGKITVG